MRAYRIANRKFADLNGIGASLYPQRWNRLNQPLIYAAETLAVARLELLVHLDRAKPPRNHVWWEIEIPDEVSMEILDPATVPRWGHANCVASQRFGGDWIQEMRTCVLIVPSRAAVPDGRNVLINPAHPEFALITATLHPKLEWDKRLFGS